MNLEDKLQSAIIMELLSESGRPKRWSELFEAVKKSKSKKSCSKSTVRNVLRDLEKEGVVERIKLSKKYVQYKLLHAKEIESYLELRKKYRTKMKRSFEKKKRLFDSFVNDIRVPVGSRKLDRNEAVLFFKGIIYDFERDLILGLKSFLELKHLWSVISEDFVEYWYVQTYNLRIMLFDIFSIQYPYAVKEAVDKLIKEKTKVINDPTIQRIFKKVAALG